MPPPPPHDQYSHILNLLAFSASKVLLTNAKLKLLILTFQQISCQMKQKNIHFSFFMVLYYHITHEATKMNRKPHLQKSLNTGEGAGKYRPN